MAIHEFLKNKNNFIIVKDNGDFNCHSLEYIYNMLKEKESHEIRLPQTFEYQMSNPENDDVSDKAYLAFDAICQKQWGDPLHQFYIIMMLIKEKLIKYKSMYKTEGIDEVLEKITDDDLTDSVIKKLINPSIVYYKIGSH